ncbi:SPJ_0845 family protein [Streptococcus panodentis]|nr:SPJ_0845 family protein [Streptococcus panodentis]
MAIKFTKSDDLDKMFEEFAALPKVEKVEFPEDEKDKKKTQDQKADKR